MFSQDFTAAILLILDNETAAVFCWSEPILWELLAADHVSEIAVYRVLYYWLAEQSDMLSHTPVFHIFALQKVRILFW